MLLLLLGASLFCIDYPLTYTIKNYKMQIYYVVKPGSHSGRTGRSGLSGRMRQKQCDRARSHSGRTVAVVASLLLL